MMTKHPALIKLLLLSLVIVIVFSAINLSWYIGVKRTYDRIAGDLDKVINTERKGTTYQKDIDGYTFSLKMTTYLSNSGFLSVEKEEGYVVNLDDELNPISDNGVHVTLFIWPKTFGGYKYGIDIYSEMDNLWEQISIDSEGNYIPKDEDNVELNEYLTSLRNQYQEEIVTMLDLAEKHMRLD